MPVITTNIIRGQQGNDLLFGSAGNDQINGGVGNDLIWGNRGDDILSGDSGNDTLYGGVGGDTLTGGSGSDLFVFSSVQDSPPENCDQITDFVAGTDRIDFRAIDADTRIPGDQAFNAASLRLTVDGRGTILSGDVNGDSMADFQVQLVGVGLTTSQLFSSMLL